MAMQKQMRPQVVIVVDRGSDGDGSGSGSGSGRDGGRMRPPIYERTDFREFPKGRVTSGASI